MSRIRPTRHQWHFARWERGRRGGLVMWFYCQACGAEWSNRLGSRRGLRVPTCFPQQLLDLVQRPPYVVPARAAEPAPAAPAAHGFDVSREARRRHLAGNGGRWWLWS